MQQHYMRSYFGNNGLIAHRSASLLAGFLCPFICSGKFPAASKKKAAENLLKGG
jgi:hypothetical protein